MHVQLFSSICCRTALGYMLGVYVLAGFGDLRRPIFVCNVYYKWYCVCCTVLICLRSKAIAVARMLAEAGIWGPSARYVCSSCYMIPTQYLALVYVTVSGYVVYVVVS